MALSPKLVHARLEESRRRLRLSRSGRYVLSGGAGALLMLVVALLLDAQFHFGTLGRWISFGLFVLPLLGAVGMAIRAWRAPLSEASVARRIEGAATGSANVLTLPRLSESLAGRMEIIPLFPFSAGELNGQREGFVKRLFGGTLAKAKPVSTKDDLAVRLIRGGYPEAIQRTDEDRRGAWFASYISTILQRDVRDLARVDGLHALPNLLKLLAARSSGLLNLADVSRDAGLPHTTLTRYLALLETVFLVHRLPAWSPNLGKRLVKAAKLHLVDTGLACHLIGTDANRLTDDRSLLGRMLETFVVGELRKQLSWADPRTSLYHFRTAAGSEVDVLLEKPDGSVAGVEIKACATVGTSEFAALQELRDQLGKKFIAGIVLYTGDQLVPFGDKLWLVPLPALWTE